MYVADKLDVIYPNHDCFTTYISDMIATGCSNSPVTPAVDTLGLHLLFGTQSREASHVVRSG